MSEKKPCKLELHYDSDGKLMSGYCDCGQKFYPFSRDKKDAKKVLQYLERQWHEHRDRLHPVAEQS